jgi:hypothetical protein
MICECCGIPVGNDGASARLRKWCSSACRLVCAREQARFGRHLPLRVLRGDANPYPNYTSALRTALLQAEAMKHRTGPHGRAA